MMGLRRESPQLGVLAYVNHRSRTADLWLREKLMRDKFKVAPTLFRKDLRGHFGCVNAIEFSNDGGELIVSGGDDRRVLVWKTEEGISGSAKPESMKGEHHSNIFCLAFDNSNSKIFSGGNDEQVIVHDLKTGATLDVFNHEDAVYGLSVDPLNDNVFASACDDGRILIYDIRAPPSEDPFCLANYMAQMHAVVYNPVEPRLLATASSKEGVGLWDVRRPRSCLLRYGGSLSAQSCMSVRINRRGDQVVALRRRLPPVLYGLHSPLPLLQFDHAGYYNSCTMKSCCFAGDNDQYIISGSDDFNLYVWEIPETPPEVPWVGEAHLVLRGHRSIVNQVRFNPSNHLIISSGVEKIIKMWSPFDLPNSTVAPNATPASRVVPLTPSGESGAEERPVYTTEEYYNLLLRSGQVMSHDYSHQSMDEDPRMMAFFDALVQRELEGFSSDEESLHSNSDLMLQIMNPSESSYASDRSAGTVDRSLSDEEEREVLGRPRERPPAASTPHRRPTRAASGVDRGEEEVVVVMEADASVSPLLSQAPADRSPRALVSSDDVGAAQSERQVPSPSAASGSPALPGRRLLSSRPSISELITLKRKEYLSNARKVDQLVHRKHARATPRATKRHLQRGTTDSSSASSSSSSSSSSDSTSDSSSSSSSSGSDGSSDVENDGATEKTHKRPGRRRAAKRRRRSQRPSSDGETSPECRPEGLTASVVAEIRSNVTARQRAGFQRLRWLCSPSSVRHSNGESNTETGRQSNSESNSDGEIPLNVDASRRNPSTIPRPLEGGSSGWRRGEVFSCDTHQNGLELPPPPPTTTMNGAAVVLLSTPTEVLRTQHAPGLDRAGPHSPAMNGAAATAHPEPAVGVEWANSNHNHNHDSLGSQTKSSMGVETDVNTVNSFLAPSKTNGTGEPVLNGMEPGPSGQAQSGESSLKFKRVAKGKDRAARSYRRRVNQDLSSGEELS